MNPQQAAELNQLKSRLLMGMIECLAGSGADCGYTDEDVDACLSIVESCMASVRQAGSDEKIMGEVQSTVKALNQLNSRCSGGLIETDQREAIGEIINKAAGYAGMDVGAADLTEEWREW